MKKIFLAAILMVTGFCLAQSSATDTKLPPQPKPQPKAEISKGCPVQKAGQEVARLDSFDLRDRIAEFKPKLSVAKCPVINGYPTFYCCNGAPGCWCYFMWDDPCLP